MVYTQSRGARKSVYSRASGTAGLGMPVVLPVHHRWQRHQDRLGSAARLQAEQRAAVEHEVELDVASASIGLELALARAVVAVAVAFDDRDVGFEKGIPDRSHQSKARIKAEFMKVVEEHATDAARFVAVLQEEVLVAPFLEARVLVCTERHQCLLAGRVEVSRVFFGRIVWRQIHTPAEPVDVGFAGLLRNEEPNVHVHGWHKRIARMKDQRHAHRLEAAP